MENKDFEKQARWLDYLDEDDEAKLIKTCGEQDVLALYAHAM